MPTVNSTAWLMKSVLAVGCLSGKSSGCGRRGAACYCARRAVSKLIRQVELEAFPTTAQQLVSPVKISKVTSLNGSNRLDVANIPIGLNGFVDGRTNLLLGSWTQITNFNSTSATQAMFVPTSGSRRFYRLRFPFAWSWP